MPESLNGPIETDDNLIIQLFANDQSNNISFVGSVINPLARAAIAVSDLLKGNRSKLSNIRVGEVSQRNQVPSVLIPIEQFFTDYTNPRKFLVLFVEADNQCKFFNSFF